MHGSWNAPAAVAVQPAAVVTEMSPTDTADPAETPPGHVGGVNDEVVTTTELNDVETIPADRPPTVTLVTDARPVPEMLIDPPPGDPTVAPVMVGAV